MSCPSRLKRLRRPVLVALIVLLWLGAVVYGFWLYEWQWQSRFEGRHASFGLTHSPPPPAAFTPGRPLVVHIIDAQCPCTRFATPHIEALNARLDPSVRKMSINATGPLADNLSWIPASPAVAIWDGRGELAYVGPHSDGAFCGQGEDLVVRVMRQLNNGQNPRWLNNEAIGCFCPWDA